MPECHFTISPSLEKKLTILSVILYSLAIFLPWAVESYAYYGFRRVPRGYFLFWSFMSLHDGETLLFAKFWFQKPLTFIPYHRPLWNGLYNGWLIIFAFQIITLAYLLTFLPSWRVSEALREKHPTWLVSLPLITILLTLYQLFIQKEIAYQDIFPVHSVTPSIGFWLAISSFIILLTATLTAPEQSHLKKIPRTLKETLKKTWPAIIIISITAFFVVEELQFHVGITKAMVVVNRKNFQEIYANPELWEKDFGKITALANIFRARVISNSPKYASCRLAVPVMSYRILATILNNTGYVAYEPVFLYAD